MVPIPPIKGTRNNHWEMLGGSQDLQLVRNDADRFRPLRMGLWDPFQMAFLWLINRVILTTNWDDPPREPGKKRRWGRTTQKLSTGWGRKKPVKRWFSTFFYLKWRLKSWLLLIIQFSIRTAYSSGKVDGTVPTYWLNLGPFTNLPLGICTIYFDLKV